MGEINKRFSYENNKVKDNLTNEYHSSNLVSVNLLNQLNDENERLKKENEELNQKNDLLTLQLDCHKHPLLKENEELVSDLNHQLEVSKSLRDVVKSLETENEELKNAIIGKIMYEEDLESFAITNGIIEHDWSRFDEYD